MCNLVSAQEIKKILRAGAITIAEVQEFTSAGTGCGRCVGEIDALVKKHSAETPANPQLRINYEKME